MLGVTTTGVTTTGVTTSDSHSHVGSQALGQVHHCCVDVFLWQFCQTVCKATFNSSVISGFGWSL